MGIASNLKTKVLGVSTGAIIGDVVNVGFSAMTFADSRKQGDNMAVSVAKTGADFVVGELMSKAGPAGFVGMLGYAAVTAGYDVMLETSKMNAKLQGRMASTGSGRMGSGYFNMSGAGYTMRQRGLNQIRNNGQNINSVLGNEARNYMKSAKTYT